MAPVMSRRTALTAMAGALATLGAVPAKAAETLRVGKAVAENFAYVPLNVGIEFGFFQKHGIAIEELGFTGGSRIAQAMAAGAVDISLSAGPDMQFVAKGAPEIAIASITPSPTFMGFCVGNASPIRGIDDLKGKTVGITSTGSLTYWLVDELNRVKGWTDPRDRAAQVAIGGSTAASLSAIKTGQVDASLSASQTGFLLEHQGEGRLLFDCSKYVGDIELFTTFASTVLIQQNPDTVRRFLKAWYEAVAFMRTHKAETVQLASKVMRYPPQVALRSYDTFMPHFSLDGKFEPKAIAKLRSSFGDLKVLDGPVDMTKLYTEEFLPRST
jgi:ABC-type nitrate/sulfonate/bicarbonate transport system substrate-binding protein